MPVKPAFAAELAILLMNLLPGARGGQFLFPAAFECST
ncbi:hypothetical protein ABH991_001745 [Bradyrhizobium ottawaense]|uniref:Uncharacterized protein n=1 Tax=Bradyrhizobium ottawaense TaxID=931866 RepID=A0ABV4FP55_9BRAD